MVKVQAEQDYSVGRIGVVYQQVGVVRKS